MARRDRRFTPGAVDHRLEARLPLDGDDPGYLPADEWFPPPADVQPDPPPVLPPLPPDDPAAVQPDPPPEHVDDPFEDPFVDPVDSNPGGPVPPATAGPEFPPDE